MKDRIAWVILAAKNRTNKKITELYKSFDKKKGSVDFKSEEALSLMDDIENAYRKGYKFITYIDEEYPEELRHIAYPPPYLFVRGNVKLLSHPLKVTIVGSRKATAYGMEVAANFAHELADNNVCIVSGGAEGIDTAALRGALRCSDNVIAVIGTGIDIDYPPENKELFKRVAEKGVVISEFPMGMKALPGNFPVRNRIMTALGDSVVVVEAARKSGALISASHAAEQGKTLFAVPGNINSPNSEGTNNLLRDGASFALSGSDILYELMERVPDKCRQARRWQECEIEDEDEKSVTEAFRLEKNEDDGNRHLEQVEKAVVNAINAGCDTYDRILDFTGMEAKKLTSVLTIMEMKSIIKLAFGNRYKVND